VAAFALAAGTALWLAFRAPSWLLVQALCEDHAKYLSADAQVRSSDSARMESWFRGQTGFSVRVPAFSDAELLGGRLCFLRGRKAALAFYRKNDRPVSLFQLQARDASLAALDRREVHGAELRRVSWKGYSLAAFEQRGVVYALVSDLAESELLELAAAAQVKARGY
jgi:anti-sigma factor RsiW